jgi:diguanylate cyclase (GGDEF)-like protein/PAS domain S-box-containing protein
LEQLDFYKNMLDEISDGVYFVNRDRVITYWNKSAEELSGYTGKEVIGRRCSDNILVHIDEKGNQLCLLGCPLAATINDAAPHEAHVFMKHKNGHRVPVFLRVKPLHDENNNIIGGVETFSDDTLENALEDRVGDLERKSLIDALTGVGNRRFADITLSTRLNELKRYGWPFGVIFMDIDDFKKVNDTYGHNVGDEVLKMLSRTTAGIIREPETSIFRWGGEEFLVVATNCNAAKLFSLAERLRLLVANSSVTKDKGMLRITVSAGVTAALPQDNAEKIIARVDGLLYQAKKAGKNCCRTDAK